VFTLYPHEHYEELCAVAATGQASQGELERLKEHLPNCPACRHVLGDFARVSAHAVPELADKHVPTRVPLGMRERFLARAYSEGLFLNKERGSRPGWFTVPTLARWSAVAVTVMIIALGFKFVATQHGPALSQSPPPNPAVRASAKGGVDNNVASLEMKQQPEGEGAARGVLGKQIDEVRKRLDTALEEKAEMGTRLSAVETVNADLRKSQAQRDAEIAQSRTDILQFKDEIAKLRSERDADRIASLVQENEITGLRDRVAKQGAELSERHQLGAAAEQARDLIVARNLHIVDVHDTDENGKGQRIFGRIFYTEGRSLVFYAYDLTDPRDVNAKIAFYVWGEKLGGSQPVKNLGIFRSDNINDGRWVVTFDDPRVLARINSVFVTVESSKKTATQPSGKKILYAFLGNKANHP
jgi:hypothetical protein